MDATFLPAGNAPRVAPSGSVIACFGDSLTAGFGIAPGQTYPDVLQRELDQRGYRYRVVNLGVSGETTEDALRRVDRILAATRPS